MGDLQSDVLNKALRKFGIINPTGTQLDRAMEAFNDMISSLGEDVFIPYRTRENFTVIAGTASYTIGSGGAYDTVRPIDIISAYIRDSSNTDHPVEVNMVLEEYNLISDKTATGRPTRLCYLKEYTLGKILFNYVPSDTETIYIDSIKQIAELTSPSDTLTIAPEYKEFFVYNLAVRLSPDYDAVLPKEVFLIASDSWNRIINKNFKKLSSPTSIDNALLGNNGSSYDINNG